MLPDCFAIVSIVCTIAPRVGARAAGTTVGSSYLVCHTLTTVQ